MNHAVVSHAVLNISICSHLCYHYEVSAIGLQLSTYYRYAWTLRHFGITLKSTQHVSFCCCKDQSMRQVGNAST